MNEKIDEHTFAGLKKYMSDMNSLVDNFRLSPTDQAMQAVIKEVRANGMADEEIAYLSETLGRSGSNHETFGSESAVDLASTGAPTSLSTLLCPLFLCSLGFNVPKLGVPGRPAGGVDTLAQLAGYRVNLTNYEVMECIERCGYAHFLANHNHAPLDALLFKFRQKSNAQNIPELTIASLLSKKVSVGLSRVGLDIRVAPFGNLGNTWDEARNHARRFRRVASILGIDSVCFLTDARFPYQPYCGRGESLVALKEVFLGTKKQTLNDHVTICLAMTYAIGSQPRIDLKNIMELAEKKLYDNLAAQGSSRDAFDEYVEKTLRGHRFSFTASDNGFVVIQIERMRKLMLRYQKAYDENGATFPDGMGIILLKNPGEYVQSGDVLATIRIHENGWNEIRKSLKNVIWTSHELEFGRGFERVANG